MKLPRIAMVTPSYNQAPYLDTCASSILDQEYPNLDYRIYDGGSTDGSIEIIKRYAARLTEWRSAPDDGPYAAINDAFNDCDAEILGWLNSDDMLMPGALHYVAEVFLGFPEVSWLTTLSQGMLNGAGDLSVQTILGVSRAGWLDGRHAPFGRQRHCHGFIQQESTFFRRSLWDRAGGLRSEYPLAADFDLWSRFFEQSDIVVTRRMIGAFRRHEANRSLDLTRYIREAERSIAETREKMNWRSNPLRHRLPSISGGLGVRRTQILPRSLLYSTTEVQRTGSGFDAGLRLLRWHYL